ncbi:SGNH/GDSL hydrolase family protein [Cyclobacterium jeungdonense]|uniref:SGNH/GDSL hydrolase family protein n=1 Tax=Cyclobacterium jeungdonense TaxID=708087 RepID=A0ABT8CDN8_9BACT|nr:SGNH/GDSL hydrolase family protein [Cyclobacterium jeungdonense]MDN3690531.1 SGNH/GDSL hydrolase family protein [Cyclobacterium jeungdonense]
MIYLPAAFLSLLGLTAMDKRALPSLFVIGDSISMQYGPFLEQYVQGKWVYDRKRDDGSSSANLDNPAGANGGDSGMVLAYLQKKVQDPAFNPDLMLINCGLHDIKTDVRTGKKQVSLDDYRENLEQIYSLLQESGIRMVWIRTTPVDDETHNSKQQSFHRYAADLEIYNAVADVVFETRNVPVIDLHRFTQNLGADLFIDHVHFGEETRARQAAFIAGFLAHYID